MKLWRPQFKRSGQNCFHIFIIVLLVKCENKWATAFGTGRRYHHSTLERHGLTENSKRKGNLTVKILQ